MRIQKSFVILTLSLFLGLGCGNETTANSTDATNGSEMVHSDANALNKNMENKNPEGAWVSSIAPDYPLTLKKDGNTYHVSWAPTIDSDMEISGKLTDKGANVYHGTVHFRAGAETSDEPMTLRFDPSHQSLSMEFTVLYEAPVLFSRGTENANASSCADLAQSIALESDQFQKLNAQHSGLQLMDETDDDAPGRSFDFRLFIENESGEIETLSRIQVDLDEKVIREYDPIEDTYSTLEGSEKLFSDAECR